jgi:hypothetical protein
MSNHPVTGEGIVCTSEQPVSFFVIVNICLPSKMPGNKSLPNQLNSEFSTTDFTVGLNIISFPLGGDIQTSSFCPSLTFPSALFIKGFH